MLFVDLWHWLDKNGKVPRDHPQLRPKVLRLARFVEYGADLASGFGRSTLVQCNKRPGRRQCEGLMIVVKVDVRILALCPVCHEEEAMIHNWETTPWGRGLPKPTKPSVLSTSTAIHTI